MALLEVCIDTIEGAEVAAAANVARLEVCAALGLGGLTPSAGLMQACAKLPVENYAMIRPRAGHFSYDAIEVDVMCADIRAAQDCRMDGVVLGALNADNTLDVRVLRKMLAVGGKMKATLHRAFDLTPNPMQALEQAIDLGFERILTSGQRVNALKGATLLKALVDQADGRISIMPGCGVRAENVAEILRISGAYEAHSSCAKTRHTSLDPFGFENAAGQQVTDKAAIETLQTAMNPK
ncbi:MAG: copper homeostasis protein CutC [Paracoccaceae bacterium]